ncbi:MAG: sensor histidine kinase, partial [Luteibaculum sp.]
KDFIENVLEQTEVLKNIANEFSQYAALNRINPEKISVEENLSSIASLFSNREHVNIEFDFKAEPFTVFMDPIQFKRVLTNLLQNAIQAVPEGDIKIKLITRETGKEKIIEITDNGIGIPEDQLEKIFQPNFTTKSSGTGLGLAMVKSMLSSASASVEVKSQINKGSTFTLVFPNA